MPRTFFQEFRTDDAVPVTVEYSYEDHGNCVCINEAWQEPESVVGCAVAVKLTAAEDDRMCAWIMEHRSWDDQADFD